MISAQARLILLNCLWSNFKLGQLGIPNQIGRSDLKSANEIERQLNNDWDSDNDVRF